MHGATLIDKNNSVLRPCILWNDTRSTVTMRIEIEAKFSFVSMNSPAILAMPGFTAPKILWVQKHEPNVFKQIHIRFYCQKTIFEVQANWFILYGNV